MGHVGEELRLVPIGLLQLAVHLLNLLIRLTKRRVLAHQVAVGILQARDESLALGTQALLLEVALHEFTQALQVDRLGDVVVGATPERLGRHLLGAVGGHHDHHGFGIVPHHLGQQRKAAFLGHLDVQEDQRRAPAVQQTARLGGVGRADDIESLTRHRLGQKGPIVRIVVDRHQERSNLELRFAAQQRPERLDHVRAEAEFAPGGGGEWA